MWLITEDETPSARLRTDYDGTWMVCVRKGPILATFPFVQAGADHVYLIAPLGNLVLRHPCEADSTRMHKDLDRLFKKS